MWCARTEVVLEATQWIEYREDGMTLVLLLYNRQGQTSCFEEGGDGLDSCNSGRSLHGRLRHLCRSGCCLCIFILLLSIVTLCCHCHRLPSSLHFNRKVLIDSVKSTTFVCRILASYTEDATNTHNFTPQRDGDHHMCANRAIVSGLYA